MKYKYCDCCKQGYFKSSPNLYVCTRVNRPFLIENIEQECPKYYWTNITNKSDVYIKQEPYVNDKGIYVPLDEYVQEGRATNYKCIITKELFVEAYNKWIKGE